MCTDIDGDAAARTAEALGARSARLDVTDPVAVQAAVDEVVSRAGRLDLMFNNAGITFGGDTELLTLDQWNAVIDVNIRGVVHGVAAAYPVMVAQGHGHIVNTASMAGLAAAGQITSYVMSKHAVVGLSLALRSEAAGRGVGVLAICPTAVETPILDKGSIGVFVGRDFYRMGQRSATFTSAGPHRMAGGTFRTGVPAADVDHVRRQAASRARSPVVPPPRGQPGRTGIAPGVISGRTSAHARSPSAAEPERASTPR